MRSKRHSLSRPHRWAELEDDALLSLRLCDLDASLKHAPVADDIADLYADLERRGIRFRPHVWVSTEWFSPDGIPGIAVPFYLCHPRLIRLERRMKGEAEGSSRQARRRILRHEAGHALDTAFGLRRRASWRATFGRASRPYPSLYSARPASRRYVQHLSLWYAQSHPTEDFAETFAVWLQPKARWRRDYAGWRALGKLEYVDGLVDEIAGLKPKNLDRSTAAYIKDSRRTLREHYRRNYAPTDLSERRYDAWLHRAFKPKAAYPAGRSASAYLGRIAHDLERALLRRRDTGAYLASHVMQTLRRRARELDLVVTGGSRQASRKALRLHERVVTDILRRNREHYVL